MNYDPTTPRVAQDDSWSCSCASTAWLLQSLGIDAPYPDVEQAMLRAGLVSTSQGLLTGTGGPLAAWLEAQYGIPAANVPSVDWQWLTAVAGTMPIALGGHGWNHWTGVRTANEGVVRLANPADGWQGVHQTLTPADFRRLGPWSAVYVPMAVADPEEDMGQIETLTNKLGYLQGDVANALQQGLDGALAAEESEALIAAYDAIQAAINSLRNT